MPYGFEIDEIAFSPDSLSSHTAHASVLGRIVSSFSLIEGVIGGIYGLLKHKDIDEALEELKQLSSNSKRVQAVREAIRLEPQHPMAAKLEDLMKRALSYAEQRNKIAHGLWGTKAGSIDIVHRIPVKKWIVFLAPLISKGTSGTATQSADALASTIEEYSLNDLISLEDDGNLLLKEVMTAFIELGRSAATTDGWTHTA